MTSEQEKLITRLQTKVERLEKQKENLKIRCEKFKASNLQKDIIIKKLQQQLIKEGKVKEPPVRRINREYPRLVKEFRLLCQEWGLKTMNMRNTTMAILRLIEPDDNGVVEYTEKDLVEYVDYLRRLGKDKYLANPTLSTYYEPVDSLVLFKHFKMIRRNLHWDEVNYKIGKVTLNGMVIVPEQTTAVCSWEDLWHQKRGVAHINDQVKIEEFKGDDLVRERERRQLKLTGAFNEQAVRDRMKYQADRYFGRNNKIMEQIVEDTPIKEEDDDIDLSEFKEVK